MSVGQSTPKCSAGSTPALTGREEWIVSYSSLCFCYKLDAYLKNERSINNLKQIKGLYYLHRTQDFEDNLSTWHIYGCLPCFARLCFSHNDVCAKKNKNKNEWKKEKKNPSVWYTISCHLQVPGLKRARVHSWNSPHPRSNMSPFLHPPNRNWSL